MIPVWQIFPYAVAALELCAGVIHLYFRNYRAAIVWFGVGIANLAFAEMK